MPAINLRVFDAKSCPSVFGRFDIDPAVRANVEKGSEIITDKFSSYYEAS